VKQGRLKKEIRETYTNVGNRDREAQSAYRTETEQGNRAESIREIVNSQWVRFYNYNPTHRYKVFAIDHDGTMHIRDIQAPNAPLPANVRDLNVDDFLEPELYTINRNELQVQRIETPGAPTEEPVGIETYEALVGMHNVTGTLLTVSGRRIVHFTNPAAARRIGNTMLNRASVSSELPDNQQFNMEITGVEMVDGRPAIDFRASYPFAGVNYDYQRYNSNAATKGEFYDGLRTRAAASTLDRVIVYYAGSDAGFYRVVNFDATTMAFTFNKITDPATGALGAAVTIPADVVRGRNSYSFINPAP
jgi:hypothetical protein